MQDIRFAIFRNIFISLAACLSALLPAWGQSTPATSCPQDFEVATIKPHPAGDYSTTLGGPRGKYQATNASAKVLVEQAFELPADQVSGGPDWVESERFDVNAKIADDCWQQLDKLHNEEQQKAIDLMLQALLKDRFRLAVSYHQKELMVYALVVAKGGPKLRPAGSPAPPSVSGSFLMGMTHNNAPVSALATFLSVHFGRTIVDQTGLTGRYDINFIVPNPEEYGPEVANWPSSRRLRISSGLSSFRGEWWSIPS